MSKRTKLLASTHIPPQYVAQPALASIAPVTIDPSTSVTVQRAALDTLINSKPSGSIIITVTPDLAAHILTINFPTNRRKKPTKIKEYTTSMEEDRWEVNGETIKFADDGYLHDGQNRMHACVRAKKEFTTHAVFGVSASSFDTIDRGKTRDGDDVLTNNGYTNTKQRAAALRWLLILQGANYKNRSQTFTPNELLARQKLLDATGEDKAFNTALNHATVLYKKRRVFVVSTMAAMLFIYNKHAPAAVDRILADTHEDKGNMRKLRIALESISASSAYRSIDDSVRNAYIILTFNAYCASKRVIKSELEWTKADLYPTFSWVTP